MCPNEIPELTLDQTASDRRKKRHMVLFLFLLPEKREEEEKRHSCTCRGEHSKEKTNGVKIQWEKVRHSRGRAILLPVTERNGRKVGCCLHCSHFFLFFLNSSKRVLSCFLISKKNISFKIFQISPKIFQEIFN